MNQDISEEVFQAKGNLMKSIQTFLEKFNRIPFGEMPKILLQAWENFFSIQHAQPEDSNELFQKLLKDLQIINKELAEYINSPSWNHPTFFNDNEEHSVQYKEYLENSSNEIAASNSNPEKEKPPQDLDIHQLIREECFIEACRKQKQNMEDTMLELIEEKQEVKNVVEQPTERGTHIAKSLQNFRVKKGSISLNHTSQISPVHEITPILSTKEPEYSLSMGYEHLSTISEMESDKVIESSVKNLLPIPSEYEVTLKDMRECVVPVCKDSSTFYVCKEHYEILSDSNDDDISSDDNAFENIDDHTEETRSGSPTTHAPEYDSFCFEIEPDQERLTSGIGNINYNSERDIHFLEELLVDDSIPIPENESLNFDHQDDPSFPRPPPEPPDVEFFIDSEPM
nr:hypothetical protein [Tanacetum cinerariifolium]